MKVFQKIILSVLLLLTLVVGFFSIEFVHGFSSAKQTSTVKKVDPKSVPTTLNVALIGSDARSKDENGRSDSLMVAQYDQKTQQAKLISIMRDSYVDIPGYGMDKINAAYSYGGVDLLNQTLKENFKFEAPYYASITFQDFIDGVYIKKGKQVMDGNTLLQYARFREDEEGDFGRIRRQQQVIKAISQQLKDVTSIFKLPKAVGKLLGSIQTNLPESVLLDCGMDFLKDDNKKIDTLSVPVDGSWDFNDNTPSGSVLELDLTKNQEAIKKFLNN
ncbi:LCP family protein [Enterococcus faecium]|nr:LCP family protein [Enterococcus faecium]